MPMLTRRQPVAMAAASESSSRMPPLISTSMSSGRRSRPAAGGCARAPSRIEVDEVDPTPAPASCHRSAAATGSTEPLLRPCHPCTSWTSCPPAMSTRQQLEVRRHVGTLPILGEAASNAESMPPSSCAGRRAAQMSSSCVRRSNADGQSRTARDIPRSSRTSRATRADIHATAPDISSAAHAHGWTSQRNSASGTADGQVRIGATRRLTTRAPRRASELGRTIQTSRSSASKDGHRRRRLATAGAASSPGSTGNAEPPGQGLTASGGAGAAFGVPGARRGQHLGLAARVRPCAGRAPCS